MRTKLPAVVDLAVKRAAMEIARHDYAKHRAELLGHALVRLQAGEPEEVIASDLIQREIAARLEAIRKTEPAAA